MYKVDQVKGLNDNICNIYVSFILFEGIGKKYF